MTDKWYPVGRVLEISVNSNMEKNSTNNLNELGNIFICL